MLNKSLRLTYVIRRDLFVDNNDSSDDGDDNLLRTSILLSEHINFKNF